MDLDGQGTKPEAFGLSVMRRAGAARAVQTRKLSVSTSMVAPLLFSPLWGLFFVGLGLNPLLQREAATQLLLQNIGAFSATAAATAAIWPRMMGMWSGFL